MLKRLFIKLPLYIIWFLLSFTVVIPIILWIITDEDYILKTLEYINNL